MHWRQFFDKAETLSIHCNCTKQDLVNRCNQGRLEEIFMRHSIKKIKDKILLQFLWKSSINSFGLVTGFSKSYLGVSLFFKVLQGVFPISFIVVMQKVINLVQSQEEGFEVILSYILCFVGLHVVSAALDMLYSKYNYQFGMRFSKMFNMKMMKKAINLSLSDFEDSDTYDIINRAQNQNGGDILNYVVSVFDILQQIISIASMAYVLFRFNWRLVAVILIIPIGRSAATFLIDKEIYEMRIGRTILERQKWYINFLTMTGKAYKEIKILGIGKFLLDKYETIQNKIISQENKMYGKNVLLGTCFDVADWVITGGIYIYTIFGGFVGRILLGDVTAYIDCTDNIKSSVEGIFSGINNLVEQSMYINLLFEYLDLPEIEDIHRKDVPAVRCIEFRNVSFKYSNGKYALKNASFFIRPGESVALIGENGSGKSTLTKLLLGLYREYEGEIFINDMNLKEIDTESYQKKIGVVFQDYMKYETSLRENVAFGDIDQLGNDEEIHCMLKSVNLDHKSKSEEGLDEVIGNWFGGQQFSIGEWQRLAIARALIKDADVYIFDEPDASLDVFRQREIIQLFKKAKKHKIGIYVSHKINYVNELADKIMVIQNGVITETGSHKELLEKGGQYYQMYMEDTSVQESVGVQCAVDCA